MGGHPKQVDSAVAKSSSAGAEASGAQSTALSNQLAGQQKAAFGTLFGPNAATGGALGGTLGGFLSPNYLSSQSGPLNGTFAQQYAQDKGQLAQAQAGQSGQLAQMLQNRGLGVGSGSGLAGSLGLQQALAQASQQGQLYSGLQQQQYQTALQNLWNASGIMSGQGTSAMQGSLQGAGQAGQTYANLYGTAGKQAQGSSLLGSIIGAGGSILGGAMSGGLICHIAAKVFGESDDLMGEMTQKARAWMLANLPTYMIAFYRTHAKWMSEQPSIVEYFAPAFRSMVKEN